jgi:hypothetical protein
VGNHIAVVCKFAVEYCQVSPRGKWERCGGYATEVGAMTAVMRLRRERWPGKYKFRMRKLKETNK